MVRSTRINPKSKQSRIPKCLPLLTVPGSQEVYLCRFPSRTDIPSELRPQSPKFSWTVGAFEDIHCPAASSFTVTLARGANAVLTLLKGAPECSVTSCHKLLVLGLNDDLWIRVRGLGSEAWNGCEWDELLVVLTRLRGTGIISLTS